MFLMVQNHMSLSVHLNGCSCASPSGLRRAICGLVGSSNVGESLGDFQQRHLVERSQDDPTRHVVKGPRHIAKADCVWLRLEEQTWNEKGGN
jgi:hypothetical protein